jgi:cytidine deaminase
MFSAKQPLSGSDFALIEEAVKLVKFHFVPKKHNLICLIKTKSGQIYSAVNLQGSFGCIDTCAEQIAIGKLVYDQVEDVESILSVRHPKPEEADQTLKVASPCGRCREMIFDYVPDAWVFVRDGDEVFKTKVQDLMPFRYQK